MELLVYVLIMFIVLNCAFKISLWNFWFRLLYGAAMGVFAYLSIDVASQQSKTQIADYLQNLVALQNTAILVIVECAIYLVFCINHLNDKRGWVQRLLFFYPSLLMMPVIFYALTQTLFVAVGVPFATTATLFGVGIFIFLPLLAQGAKWLLPDEDSRIEAMLLLTTFVCILGLLSTENGTLIYASQQSSFDWTMLTATLGTFLFLIIVGIVINKIKWKIKKS